MMTVSIREQTARQLTKFATEQATSPEALVEKAIRELLRAEANRILAREMDAFRNLYPQLRQQYPQQYVAFRQGQLIDHDQARTRHQGAANGQHLLFTTRQVARQGVQAFAQARKQGQHTVSIMGKHLSGLHHPPRPKVVLHGQVFEQATAFGCANSWSSPFR